MPELAQVKMYSDYKSPYSYLAFDPGMALEQKYKVRVGWRPLQLAIEGAAERSAAAESKIKYLYLDARRWGNLRPGGLVIKGPVKVYDRTPSLIGGLYAETQGRLVEQWIYFGARENQYITFVLEPGRARGNAVEERVRPREHEAVPAHVGHGKRALEAAHPAGQQPEPLMASVLIALLEEHLHADADAEKGRAPPRGRAQRDVETSAADLGHGGAEGAVAGKDERVGSCQHGGIAGGDELC